MKLSEIKPLLNEYAKGSLDENNDIDVAKHYLETAEQQRYHIVIKNGGPTVFVFKEVLSSRQSIYILATMTDKSYVGHCIIEKISDHIWQPLSTSIISEFRGNQLAPKLYAFIAEQNDAWIINAPRLSSFAEKMWLKLPRKIYNLKHDKFYELNDPNAGDPRTDTDRINQEWFFAFKESPGLLEMFDKPTDLNWDYDRFLTGGPIIFFKETQKSLFHIPMTPDIEK